MPVTKPKAPVPASRYPPVPAQNASAAASKKKKKKKGKGKMGDGPVQPNHPYRQDQDVADEDEDEMPLENDKHRRALESEFEGLRMSTTATAQAELLAAANELYKRMESEQLANDSNDGEYWKQLPSHIRSFVETTYAHGAALTPNERSKSQAMLALAQTMVDEATNRFPAGGFPPPFDPSLLSDPKFAEKFSMKAGTLNAMNLMREYADEAYDDYVSEADEDDLEDEQRYDAEDAAQKKKKRKKKTSGVGVNGTNAQAQPLPPIIPTAPNPAPAIRRDAPSVAQPRPSSRAAGKQPVYSQSAVPPSRTTRSTATKSPVPPNPYNHGYSKSSAVNGNTALAKRPTGGGTVEKDKSKLWSTSTEEERERIKEFWLGLSEAERRDLVKLEKEAVLKKMKEQQKHSCSCAVCGRKRNAIEEELEVLYDAYYEELEQYAIHQQQYQSSGGKITPPPGPGPFPGSVALDKNGAVIGAPPLSKHPTRGGVRSAVNGVRGRRVAADSADEYDDDEYDDDDDEYDDEEEDEDEDEEDEEDDPNDRKLAQRRRAGARGPPSRRANGREDFFNFGSLTAAGPGNILTVADDLLKNDGGKFLEMMEQLAERRMQRDEEAAKEVEMESDEEDEDVEGSEDEEDDDGDDDDESEEEEDIMSEEQKMEEGRKMFSIFAARMFEQRVLNAYREKVAAERQEQLLRELADEDKVQAERDAKRAKENQKKKDKKKQQKQAKEAEKAKKDAEKAAEEAAVQAKQEAMEEEAKKKREEEKAKREADRKAKEEEKARQAEERRLRIAEQKAAEAERKREKEERERKERLVRQEKEATAKAERAEREKRAKEERLAREVKEKEEREKRDKEEKEKRDKERLEQQKAEEKRKQESLIASKARTGGISPSSSINNLSAGASSSVQSKKPSAASAKTNGPTAPSQRVVSNPLNRPPPMQQPSQPSTSNPQQRPSVTGPSQQPPLPIGLQLPPNMGLQPLGIPPYNPLVSPVAMSPRVGYGPPSSAASASSAFSPLAQFATTSQPPLGLTSLINGNTSSNMAYPYDHLQSPVISPPPSNSVQQPRGSGLPSALSLKTPVTPTTNGIPPIGVPPVSSASSSQAHMRRASAQANPSPFGAIGKPAGSLARAGSSSVVGEEDRISVSGLLSASKPSPPSPDRPLGSAALVDENDTIVELPKRRTAAPGVGWGDTIGPPAPVGARWGRGPQPSWGPGAIGAGIPGGPLPIPLAGPSPIGAPWSATPGRPQPGRLGSPFMPS